MLDDNHIEVDVIQSTTRETKELEEISRFGSIGFLLLGRSPCTLAAADNTSTNCISADKSPRLLKDGVLMW